MNEYEFDFFPDVESADAPVTEAAQRRPPPPGRRRRLGRLIGLVSLVVLVPVLVVSLTSGANAATADRNYLAKLSPIAADSQRLGGSVTHLLSAGSSTDMVASLDGLSHQAQQDIARMQAISPPARLRAEHQAALTILQYRLNGVIGLRDGIRTALGSSHVGATAADLLAAQADRLVASDVLWDDLFRAPMLVQLRRARITGLPVPESHFLGNADLATSSAMASLLQRLRGNPKAQAQGPVLKLGDRGSAVATWQAELNRWLRMTAPSQKPLTADGSFGAATAAATKALQRSSGLSTDGVVGPATRRALQAALAGRK